jgi:2-methylisocitrate lyase-like PEP mutase family enzyme
MARLHRSRDFVDYAHLMPLDSATRENLAAKAAHLQELHVPGRPLVLANAWDAASARAVVEAGFAAVATGSAAVAASLGFGDHEAAPVRTMLDAVSRIAGAVSVPVTADLEAGYGMGADELVDRLLASGAVGCNLEDTDHRNGRLIAPDDQVGWLSAVRAAADRSGVPIVINARTDVFLRGEGSADEQLTEAILRGRRYRAAGADCFYPIWVVDEATIAALVEAIDGPVNVYARPEAPSLPRLAELGVARVSYGPWMHRLVMRELDRALEAVRHGRDPFPR